MEGESSQKAIKIDGKLRDELEEWIETEGESQGFNSMARFATIAVSNELRKRKEKRIRIVNFQNNTVHLTDNELPEFQSLVEIFFDKKNIACNHCKSNKCEHVAACWKNDMIRKQLEKKGLKTSQD